MEELLEVNIRSYRPADTAAVRQLYREGLLGGNRAENDTGIDMDMIQDAYMVAGNHLWVAEHEDSVVGMIGVQQHDSGVGEIRRLRVRNDLRRRGVGSKLMETALTFCRDNGYLKVALDTYIEREPALRLFERFNFKHGRTASAHGKELLFFYLDIYGKEKHP